MRKQKRASPSGRPFRGKEGGVGHCPFFFFFFTQTVRRECHTHSHKPQSKSLTPQPLEVCYLFSQEWLRRAQTCVFHTHACSHCTYTLQSNTISHSLRSLSIGPIVVWASGNPFQKKSELLFMSSTLKRVLYSPSQIRAKGKGEHEDELLKQRKKKQV